MISPRRATSAACAVAAAAAVAGAIVFRRPHGAADAATTGKLESAAEFVRASATGALESRARKLESDVERAAAVPQLKAALGDDVDAATLLDLFETEDWWTPFRTQATAIVAGNRLVAVRGDKQMPLPDAEVLAHAREAGLASGVAVGGPRPVLEAVASTGVPRKGELTFLVFGVPFDAAALEAAVRAPILISDGQAVIVTSGAEKQVTLLRAAVGHEHAGTFADPAAGWRAVAAPISGKLWLWAWQAAAADATPSSRAPWLFSAAALLLGLTAVAFGRGGRRGATAEASLTPLVVGGGAANDVGARSGRPRRGTLPYDTDEMAHRPTELPSSDTGLKAVAGGTPRYGQAVSQFVAERSRVEPASNSFGRYRLIDRLGEGGMAEIYTAVLHGAEGFRKVYVLKRLRPEVARNRSAVEQFIDEAKLGSSLVHSNIVPVFDFGKVVDEYFMAQEYIIGRDMIRLLERHVDKIGRPLDERLVLYIAHEVLEALAYAHNQTDATGKPLGLVHRDIAPGNIMLTTRGEVKLADFGIVKAEGRLSTTDVGVVKGNVSFMSPEQARGQSVDGRSDLFSLGLVMYYCLTNDPLYPGSGTFEQLMKAATGPRTEHIKLLRELPPTASAAVVRALAVAPEARFQTAAEFAASLAPFVAGVRVEAAALMQRLFGEELRKEAAI
jgi:tRNA A-37 threonylcarbamoyl transferase component Bud32